MPSVPQNRTSLAPSPDHGYTTANVVGKHLGSHHVSIITAQDLVPSFPGFHAHEDLFTSETLHLLRTYQKVVGPWMDLFDHQQAYQRDLMRLIRTSSLLLHASCALAAQYLTLRVDREIWDSIARERYVKGLRLLAENLQDPQLDAVHAVASTILLSSYELLAFPGDYYRSHFEGAKTLLESYSFTIMSSRLGIASFWIFARHDVNAALTYQIPTSLNPRTWPNLDHATAGSDAEEDDFGNEMLRLAAELTWLVYGESQTSEGPIAAEEWSRLRTALQEWCDVFFRSSMGSGKVASNLSNHTSYWFPTPAAGMSTTPKG